MIQAKLPPDGHSQELAMERQEGTAGSRGGATVGFWGGGRSREAECSTEHHKFRMVQNRILLLITRNTLDCDQSNYSSRIVFSTYLLNLVKPEIAPFDPSTLKTPY